MKPKKLLKIDFSSKELLFLVIILAVVLRMFYGVLTGPYQRQHDWTGKSGHYEYVKIIANEGHLPSTNEWQFCHPPLNHLVLAGGYSVLSDIITDKDLNPDDAKISDILQVVPFVYSVLLLYIALLVLKELSVTGVYRLIAFSVFAFHPTNIILSASLNNDMLTYLLYGVSFLFTIRWYKNPTFFNIIGIALGISLSMLSKFSGVLIAPITAVCFLVILIKAIKERKGVGNLILQFAVFGIVCIPLGLSYTLRNYLLFGQELGYVAYMGDDNWQYIDLPFIQRLFGYYAPDFESPFSDAYRHNLLSTAFKTSLFGEWGAAFGSFSTRFGEFFPTVLGRIVTFFGAIFTAAASFLSARFAFGKTDKMLKFIVLGNFVLTFGFFLYFNANYPFGCTADFRYLTPLLFSLVCIVPLGLKEIKSKTLKAWLSAVSVLFVFSSSIFYLLCG